MPSTQSEAEKKARSAAISYAFFRIESAVIISGTLLLIMFYPKPFPNWPVWAWPALGLAALAIIVISSLTDKKVNTQVHLSVLQGQFETRKIQDTSLREEFEKTLEYQRYIEIQVQQQQDHGLKRRLVGILPQLSDWIDVAYQLTLRLDAYWKDPLLAQERASVAKELESLNSRMQFENNAKIRKQLEDVLDSKRKQWDWLRALDDRMQQAETQLEQSNVDLAKIYSHVQFISAQSVAEGAFDDLQSTIDTQLALLRNLAGLISEAYGRQDSGALP